MINMLKIDVNLAKEDIGITSIYKNHLVFQCEEKGMYIINIYTKNQIYIDDNILYLLDNEQSDSYCESVIYASYCKDEYTYKLLIKCVDLKNYTVSTLFEIPVDLQKVSKGENKYFMIYDFPYYNFKRFYNVDDSYIIYGEDFEITRNSIIDLNDKSSFKLDGIEYEICDLKLIKSNGKRYLFLQEFEQQNIFDKINWEYEYIKDYRRIRKATILNFDKLIKDNEVHIVKEFELDVYQGLNYLCYNNESIYFQMVDIRDIDKIHSKIIKVDLNKFNTDITTINRYYNLRVIVRKVDDDFEFYSYKDSIMSNGEIKNLIDNNRDIHYSKKLSGFCKFFTRDKDIMILETPSYNCIYNLKTREKIKFKCDIYFEYEDELILLNYK